MVVVMFRERKFHYNQGQEWSIDEGGRLDVYMDKETRIATFNAGVWDSISKAQAGDGDPEQLNAMPEAQTVMFPGTRVFPSGVNSSAVITYNNTARPEHRTWSKS